MGSSPIFSTIKSFRNGEGRSECSKRSQRYLAAQERFKTFHSNFNILLTLQKKKNVLSSSRERKKYMNEFVNAISNEASLNGSAKLTENGAVARSTTGDCLLDFYALSGAMRSRSEKDILDLFKKAWNENPLYALKTVFMTRDIRGGRGERRTARIILKYLATVAPKTVIKNFDNIMEMGRADDFYEFVGTPIEKDMWKYLSKQIVRDLKNMRAGKPISLTAKWLKSINTSSKESRALGRKTARALGLTEREYRKTLSRLRNYLKVVEVKMSAGEWNDIDYAAVPAIAMNRYRKAFKRHNPSAFDTYIEKVEKGEEKINASTLYPYDLVEKLMQNNTHWTAKIEEDPVVEAQWKALPNYIEGENNVLVMADVSGSMFGRPMATSIGLAIYFAERNKGAFKNTYMTFTNSPHYIQIQPGQTLSEKVNAVMRTDVGFNTNLERAFMQVLDTAVTNHVPQEDMPKAMVVISDMEIDPYFRGRGLDFVSEMARRFRAAGYQMPRLVLWNAEARSNTFHASSTNPYVTFASGQGVAEFKNVLAGISLDAYAAMMEALNDERYASVIL